MNYANGAFLHARVDFDIVVDGVADFQFSLGALGVEELFGPPVDPSFGSATLDTSLSEASVLTSRETRLRIGNHRSAGLRKTANVPVRANSDLANSTTLTGNMIKAQSK